MIPTADDERACRLRERGEQARRDRDLVAARSYYEEACGLLRGSADRLRFAHAVRHLGDVYTKLREWSLADGCFAEALGIYREHEAAPGPDLANAIRAYAVLKSAVGAHEEARGLWAEAGRLYEAAGILAGVEECRGRVSI